MDPNNSMVQSNHGLPPHPKTNDESAVELLDLIVLVFLAICIVANIPRMVGRFSQPGSWRQGWILGFSDQVAARRRRQVSQFVRSIYQPNTPSPWSTTTPVPPLPTGTFTKRKDEFDEIDLATEKPIHSSATSAITSYGGQSKLAPITKPLPLIPSADLLKAGPPTTPLHVPSWSSIFHPISDFLHKRPTVVDYTWGQILVYVVYGTMILIGMFVVSTPKVSVRRAGWIAVSQLPFVLILASKNNLVALAIGTSYERLNYIHRFVGRIITFATAVHIIGYMVIWTQKGILSASVTEPIAVTGWVATVGLLMCALGSMGYMRRRMYEIFWVSHWIGYVILIVAVTYHVETTIFWTIASGFILGLDHISRILKSNVTTAHLTPLPKMNCTKVEIPELKKGWKAGQHVRIKLLTSRLGWLSMFSAMHPFTIATVAETGPDGDRGEGVVLYVQSTGKMTWTGRLLGLAKEMSAADGGEKGLGFIGGNNVRVLIEGPYGGLGHTVFSSFSSAFVVAGGSGITFALSTVEEIIQDVERGCASTRLIHLVWVVQDPASLGPLFPKLKSLLGRAAAATPTHFTPLPFPKAFARKSSSLKAKSALALYSLKLKISIHYSRASATSFATEQSFKSQGVERLHLKPGRPDLSGMLDELTVRTIGSAKLGMKLERGGSVGTRPERLKLKESNFPPSAFPGASLPKEDAPNLNRSNTGKSERTALANALGVQPSSLVRSDSTKTVDSIRGPISTIPSGNKVMPKGVIVAVCGPIGLCDDVRNAASVLDRTKRKEVGGIEVHEEVFGW